MKHFLNHSLALTPTGTNHPVPMWLGLPKYGGHIQIASWDWPLADAKSAWVLPGGLLAASSQKSNRGRRNFDLLSQNEIWFVGPVVRWVPFVRVPSCTKETHTSLCLSNLWKVRFLKHFETFLFTTFSMLCTYKSLKWYCHSSVLKGTIPVGFLTVDASVPSLSLKIHFHPTFLLYTNLGSWKCRLNPCKLEASLWGSESLCRIPSFQLMPLHLPQCFLTCTMALCFWWISKTLQWKVIFIIFFQTRIQHLCSDDTQYYQHSSQKVLYRETKYVVCWRENHDLRTLPWAFIHKPRRDWTKEHWLSPGTYRYSFPPLCLRRSGALGFPINFPPSPLCENLEVCNIFLELNCRWGYCGIFGAFGYTCPLNSFVLQGWWGCIWPRV